MATTGTPSLSDIFVQSIKVVAFSGVPDCLLVADVDKYCEGLRTGEGAAGLPPAISLPPLSLVPWMRASALHRVLAEALATVQAEQPAEAVDYFDRERSMEDCYCDHVDSGNGQAYSEDIEVQLRSSPHGLGGADFVRWRQWCTPTRHDREVSITCSIPCRRTPEGTPCSTIDISLLLINLRLK